MKRVFVLLVLLGGWLLFAAPPASAHVEIISSAPSDGSRLSGAPPVVSVRLSENIGVQPNSLQVVDQQGKRADTGPVFQPGEVAEELAVRLRPGLPEGSYLVEYAFVSADSHPVRGTFAFVIGTGPLITSAGAVSAATGTDPVVDALFTAFRWVSFLAVALLGGLVFALYCRPAARVDPRVLRLLSLGCLLTAVAAIAALVLQGPYTAGRGVPAVFDSDMLTATLRVAYGKLLLLRVVAAGLLWWLIRRLLVPEGELREHLRGRYENLTMVSGFVVLLSFSATGHAVTDSLMFFSVTADIAHFGAMAVWIGGLVQLALCLRRPTPEEDVEAVVGRFSRIAITAVAVLLATGVYLVLRNVPSIPALWTTTYGIILLVKLAGFAALLLLANVSRRAVQRGIVGREHGGVLTEPLNRLRLAVGIEVAIAAAVLALAAILSSISPTG